MIVKLLIGLLAVLFATEVVAVELTLERCVQLGLEQNDHLKAMQAELEIVNQDTNIAFADFFPSVRLESSYTLRDEPPTFTLESSLFGPGLPPEDAQVEGEKEHYTVGVKLEQTLFAGGRLLRTHEEKNLLLDAQRYQFEDQKNQLTYQIKKVFYNALTRQQEFEAVIETVSTKTEDLRIRKELLKAGKATRDEILATESQLLLSRADMLRAEQAYHGTLDDLQALIGIDESITLVAPRLYTTLSPTFEIQSQDVFMERDDLKRLEAQIQAADKDVQVAKSAYYPELNLEASYLKQRETNITEPEIWEAGLRLDWQLFEAGKTNAEVAKAKASNLRLKHLRRDLERTINNEVKAALRLVREREALVEAHRVQVLAIEQEYQYQLELYQSGKLKPLGILNSRARLAMSNASYQAAINHLRTALVALETTLSIPLDEQLIPHEPYQPALKSLEDTLKAPIAKTAPLTTQTFPAVGAKSFAVQLAAFKSEKNANAFLNKLRKKYPSTHFEIVSIDGWKKVRTMHFSSRESAATALAELGEKGFIVDDARTDDR